MSRRLACFAATIAGCLFALAACDKPSTPASQPASSQPRIVSLSPAISRTLVDCDLAKFVVGRTPYCSSLDQSIPVVGDLQTIDYEALIRLNPTHILVQPPAAGVDPVLVELAKKQHWLIADWRLNGLSDIRQMLLELPERLYGGDQQAIRKLREWTIGTLQLLDLALDEPKGSDPPAWTSGRVLMVNAVDPVMAFGATTYLDDILTALGGRNAVGDKGWVQLSLEDIVRLAPEAIILVKPGASPDELTEDLGPLATIDVPAVRDHRLALLAHPDAFLPSSAVVGVASELRSILERFAQSTNASDNRP